MSFYPVLPSVASGSESDGGEGEVPGGGALMVAVRLSDLVSPGKRPLQAGDRSALAVAGTERIRTGEQVVFLKVVAVAAARVRRDGRVQAQGSPCDHATLGPLEEWLEEQAGPGVIGGIADRAVLREEFVKGTRKRLLARAFVIRAIVLMTLVPDADVREVIIALAGDLAMVPWARAWRPASPRAFGDWRRALGPGPLEELQAVVLRASHAEHEVRDWRAVVIGRLKVSSADGTLIRVPDTPANRAAFGSTGTGDDSAPFPQLRALPLTDASTRGLLGMPHGPAGTDKAAAEQKLLDAAMGEYPHLFTMDRIWLFDRNFPRRCPDRPPDRPHARADPAEKRHPAGNGVANPARRVLYRGDLRRRRHRDRPGHRVLRRRGRPGRAGDVLPGHRPDGYNRVPCRRARGAV